MKKIVLSALLLSVTAMAGAQEPVTIVKQGHFPVGGTTIQRPGTYDNSKIEFYLKYHMQDFSK